MTKNKVQAAYYQKNKEHLKKRSNERYHANKEQCRETAKIWEEKNKDKRREYFRNYFKKRKQEDPVFRAMHNTRKRVWFFLKGKQNRFSKKLGCNRNTFKAHIEARFQSGMTWNNYGEWEIDHVIPLSSVNLTNEIDKLSHFSNLQPLWKNDNRSKGNKLE